MAPLLFMMVFGIIQFGIFFAQDLALSNGARQAARTAAVSTTGTCGETFAEARQGSATIALNQDDPSFDVSVFVPSQVTDRCPGGPPTPNTPGFKPCSNQVAGSEVRVVIEYDAQLAIPLVGDFGTITLNREGNFRCEFR